MIEKLLRLYKKFLTEEEIEEGFEDRRLSYSVDSSSQLGRWEQALQKKFGTEDERSEEATELDLIEKRPSSLKDIEENIIITNNNKTN